MTTLARLGPAVRATVPPFHVMDVWAAAGERARTHGDLVNLSAGQPSTPAPADVRAAAARALDEQILGYSSSLGTVELRDAIAAHHRTRYADDSVRREDVVVTTGGSGGFLLAFLAAFDVGDTVVLARPGYPCYRNILAALGCEVVELPCGEETRFQPTVAMLDALDRPPKGLVVASPANPTGSVIEPDELAALARWCEEHGVQLISDEIYHGIEYGSGESAPPTASAWSTSREAIVVTSFSKYWSMTGWRLGWLLVPERLRRAVDVIAGNFTVCPPVPPQYAALDAFTPASLAEADGHVERYAHNRRLLLDGLPGLGLTRLAPADGAFYVYADVGHLTDDTLAFGQRMLAETGVAVAPGIDFDPIDGHSWIRLSFAGATEDVRAGIDRLGRWFPTL
ncbi:aminotransferase class I/II-fold pyridoxal phosphate-dependent enzyme [Actinomycetospora sp. OC33-EN06]|uniref:Aminotransferase n=2 Tax=Actinomycetospora aeridis TaxID=3129231 RepID=A0ABU8N8J5_9PSEU